MRKLTQEEVIARFREVHGDRYDYSRILYKNARSKVEIICKKHGSFWQKSNDHMRGVGCPYCSKKYKKNKDIFVSQSILIHGESYDYSKVVYSKGEVKVCIICPIHGEFWQRPSNHLRGHGCPKCRAEKMSKMSRRDVNTFICMANKVHQNKYDYSLVNYKNSHTKIKIICPIHGAFKQTPSTHLDGCGCPYCAIEYKAQKRAKPKEDFINVAKETHRDQYDYSKVEYKSTMKKVCIICKECGTEFWQTPNNHLNGHGCPHCSVSCGEKKIKEYLEKSTIEYQPQYKIVLDDNKLFSRNKLRVDFYLPNDNIIIEFHGEQHYRYIPFFHRDDDAFARQLDRDKRLRQYCKQHKIKLIEIKYNQINKIDKILNNKLKL